jgi:hypothetical protein
MAIVATANVSSAIASFPCFVAPERPSATSYIGCESLDEADLIQELAKLDVVVGNGAEQENQLELKSPHRSTSYLVPRSRPRPSCRSIVFNSTSRDVGISAAEGVDSLSAVEKIGPTTGSFQI